MIEYTQGRLAGESRSSKFQFDVVGVGAINLDYIATASAVHRQTSENSASLTTRLEGVLGDGTAIERGAERDVGADVIYAALEAADAGSLKVNLGGSAFNAIMAIAQTDLGLRLGYVGVAGRMPMPGISSTRQMQILRIDDSGVRQHTEVLSGICFSFIEDGERTLLTHAGANELMADYLEDDFEAVVKYLSAARVIHLTSFLDPRTPQRMLAVLETVKQRSPETMISFDPGHVWATSPTPAIAELVGLADFLILNNREFRALGEHAEGDDDTLVADRLLCRAQPDAMILVKKPSGISTFTRTGGEVRREHYAQSTLPAGEVEDDTGAGDVFAAGLLAVITSDRLQVELGALLGMALARHKLRYVGHGGHAHFPKVARDLIRSLDAGRRAMIEPPGVFIAHGGSSDWLAVKELIETELGLPVHFFERQTWGSVAVTEALEANLALCSFAVCVLTVEDLTAEGKRFARQNVVHEIGLFQGRYGFDRVAVLAEDGCDYVPELAAPYSISFPRNGIQSAFWKVRRILKERSLDVAVVSNSG
ncbi:PfkB family carbohydrate kinase [Dactylosporangium sp. NPDC000555]|uniref:PfkB family carbohydrate kinase n=1 Tax=Dactylosporangium sp. NPDC000555 TaxID=3154260 RepID=UPI0033228814